MLEAALLLRELEPDIIDVNLGCSAQAIVNRGAGAGLLKEPQKIAEIFNKLTSHLDIPVTGKIRLGWDKNSLNYMLVSRIIEENGGQMLAVHARTKVQGLRNPADWDAVAEIKQSLSIPVIGNGGIERAEDVNRMLDETNCNAVMVGRAAMGNPWIFSGRELEDVSAAEVCEMILKHLERMQSVYNDYVGLVRFRKHLKHYLRPFEISREIKAKLLTTEEIEDFVSIIKETFSGIAH
jgi:nifR3 family TIM-barrel protein